MDAISAGWIRLTSWLNDNAWEIALVSGGVVIGGVVGGVGGVVAGVVGGVVGGGGVYVAYKYCRNRRQVALALSQ